MKSNISIWYHSIALELPYRMILKFFTDILIFNQLCPKLAAWQWKLISAYNLVIYRLIKEILVSFDRVDHGLSNDAK